MLTYTANTDRIVWNGTMPNTLLNGGTALVTRYGFLDDKLGIGFDGGWASGGDTPMIGFGQTTDGKPYANSIANFRFHPNFKVDQILFRHVVGSVTNAFYLQPHLEYLFAEGFGLRGDVVSAFANSSEATPGKSAFLGMEFDAKFFYESVDGFFVSSVFGVMVPFAGLNHPLTLKEQNLEDYIRYGSARTAISFQVMGGIAF
jgi:uncharacterized protein (TIGR04551 family)